jgi:trimethylamine---corrinoid protein Co-methyltransferase
MRPRIRLLSPELIGRILREALELLMSPGVHVGSAPVVELLRSAGVEVNDGVASLPESLVQRCLASAPRGFYLYNRQGGKAVQSRLLLCADARSPHVGDASVADP